MAITQDRMLALVFAAVDYKDAYERLRRFAIQQARHAAGGDITHEDAIALVGQAADVNSMLQRPVESATTIILESKHFTTSRIRENQKRARKEAERRRSAGIPKREPIIAPDLSGYDISRLTNPNPTAPKSAPWGMFETKDRMQQALADFAVLAEQYGAPDTNEAPLPGTVDGDDPDPTGDDLGTLDTL